MEVLRSLTVAVLNQLHQNPEREGGGAEWTSSAPSLSRFCSGGLLEHCHCYALTPNDIVDRRLDPVPSPQITCAAMSRPALDGRAALQGIFKVRLA